MRQHKPPAQARQRQGTTAGTTWEPRTIWERRLADRECRRKKSTAIRYVNCAVARSRSSDDAPELRSHSRLRLFSSDCCRSRFVWRRLRIAGQALPLAIIVLIPRSASARTMALRRFVEVSVGIIVALVAVALRPEHQPSAVKSAGE